jgi:hypothetical protein
VGGVAGQVTGVRLDGGHDELSLVGVEVGDQQPLRGWEDTGVLAGAHHLVFESAGDDVRGVLLVGVERSDHAEHGRRLGLDRFDGAAAGLERGRFGTHELGCLADLVRVVGQVASQVVAAELDHEGGRRGWCAVHGDEVVLQGTEVAGALAAEAGQVVVGLADVCVLQPTGGAERGCSIVSTPDCCAVDRSDIPIPERGTTLAG